MTVKERIDLLVQLGEYLQSGDEYLKAVMHRTAFNNQWLTIENSLKVAEAIGKHCLSRPALEAWCTEYKVSDTTKEKKVGIILSGQVPLAGLQDIICVFAAGHQAIIKLSEEDEYLIPHLLKQMMAWDPRSATYFSIGQFLKGFDAIITNAQGKTNPYFEKYFSEYPHLIRKEQHSIAILNGQESSADLLALGKDVFANFGLGSENISKLYVPEGYDFNPLLEMLHEYKEIVLNSKYKNNFDYNYALLMLNNAPYHANGCILITEDASLSSRIACLHYEFYQDASIFDSSWQKANLEHIKYIVSKNAINGLKVIAPGQTQIPSLYNYGDGTDTMAFLLTL